MLVRLFRGLSGRIPSGCEKEANPSVSASSHAGSGMYDAIDRLRSTVQYCFFAFPRDMNDRLTDHPSTHSANEPPPRASQTTCRRHVRVQRGEDRVPGRLLVQIPTALSVRPPLVRNPNPNPSPSQFEAPVANHQTSSAHCFEGRGLAC